MRTEDLLKQSQSLAQQLQTRQEELQKTNEELQEKARLLAHQNQEVERKNQEVEQARQALEEKAKQLALTSQVQVRVPRQHVARAAHAAQQPAHPLRPALARTPSGNLTAQADGVRQDDPLVRQRPARCSSTTSSTCRRSSPARWSWTSASCGWTTCTATSSGRSATSPSPRTSTSTIRLRPAPAASRCYTDAKRLQQIIKNLLSNAFKFTHHGQVTLTVEPAHGGLEPGQRGAEPGAGGARLLRVRHRHRHPAGQAADHLRGVPAGRRLDQPQVRRHRPGPGDQPRAVAAAGRRDPPGVARPGRGSTFTLYLPHDLHAAARRPASRGRPPATPPAGAAAGRRRRRRRPTACRNGRPQPRPPRPAAEPTAGRPGQRGRRRPRRHPAGRPGAADRRERRRLRPVPARRGPREGVQGAGHLARAPRPWPWPASTSPTPSRSTSTCPTSTAGACWSGSRTTWPPGTSRCASSPPTRPATGPWRPGRLAFVAKPIQSRDVLDGLLDHLNDFVDRPTRQPAGGRAGRRRGASRSSSLLGGRRRAGDRRRRRPAAAAQIAARAAGRLRGRRPGGRTWPTSWPTWPTAARRRALQPAAGRSSTATASRPSDDGAWKRLGRRLHRPARPLARAAARPDDVLPAPHRRPSCPRRKRQHADRPAPVRPGPGRQEGADRRRRHAQHLRPVHGAGGARHGDRLGRQRPRRHPHARRRSRTSTSC